MDATRRRVRARPAFAGPARHATSRRVRGDRRRAPGPSPRAAQRVAARRRWTRSTRRSRRCWRPSWLARCARIRRPRAAKVATTASLTTTHRRSRCTRPAAGDAEAADAGEEPTRVGAEAEMAELAAQSAEPSGGHAPTVATPNRRRSTRRAASRASSRACSSHRTSRSRLADLKRLVGERDGKKLTAALEALQRAPRAAAGIELASTAGGWQFRTNPENAAVGRASWSRAARSACRAPCSRRWRSSPTASPSRAPRSTRSAASTAARC